MANSMKEIQDRMATVKGTSQITNAMKLVSMAKFQTYSRKAKKLNKFVEQLGELPTEAHERETIDREKSLAICFSADLGLASMYHKSLYRELLDSGIKHVFWVGGKYYEQVKNNRHLNLINEEPMSSEEMDIEALFDQVLEWMDDYDIFVAKPRLRAGDSMEVEWVNADDHLKQEELVEYLPDFASVDHMFIRLNTLASLYDCLYHSKVVEHTIRRLAMDSATDNAEELHDDLQLQYNRLRQEQITQEILELSSGMESR